MNMLRSLLLLLLVSALGSTSQAHSVAAVDGYVDQANAQQSLLSSQELEGDEPDSLVSSHTYTSPSFSLDQLTSLQSPARVENYSDFLARAPPANL